MTQETPLVQVRNLTKHFPIRKGVFGRVAAHVRAVDDVSFNVPVGKTLSLVGESGCGKTTTGRTLLRLIPPTDGEVHFDGTPVFEVHGKELRDLRQRMQIIFQDPYASLNPRMTVSDIVGEGLYVHSALPPAERRARVSELLEVVGLPPGVLDRYPHEFSGGQRQRIGIARALSTDPSFIVCDEAVSALDVSIQAQIINLLEQLQEERGIAYLFIAHDLSVVRHLSERVAVMYLGHMMETAPCDALFEEPHHPYTRALLSAIPEPKPGRKANRILLTGDVPSPVNPPAGCRFHPRCPEAMDKCRHGSIPTFAPSADRRVKCLLYDNCPVAEDVPVRAPAEPVGA